MRQTIVYGGRASGKAAESDRMFEKALVENAELAREQGCGLTVDHTAGARLIYIDQHVPVGEIVHR